MVKEKPTNQAPDPNRTIRLLAQSKVDDIVRGKQRRYIHLTQREPSVIREELSKFLKIRLRDQKMTLGKYEEAKKLIEYHAYFNKTVKDIPDIFSTLVQESGKKATIIIIDQPLKMGAQKVYEILGTLKTDGVEVQVWMNHKD